MSPRLIPGFSPIVNLGYRSPKNDICALFFALFREHLFPSAGPLQRSMIWNWQTLCVQFHTVKLVYVSYPFDRMHVLCAYILSSFIVRRRRNYESIVFGFWIQLWQFSEGLSIRDPIGEFIGWAGLGWVGWLKAISGTLWFCDCFI